MILIAAFLISAAMTIILAPMISAEQQRTLLNAGTNLKIAMTAILARKMNAMKPGYANTTPLIALIPIPAPMITANKLMASASMTRKIAMTTILVLLIIATKQEYARATRLAGLYKLNLPIQLVMDFAMALLTHRLPPGVYRLTPIHGAMVNPRLA